MTDDLEISRYLQKVLKQHGHGFQYAVLRRAEELSDAHKSSWIFEAAEFPVQVGGSVAHIDFVLRSPALRIFLVAECKRADPARARWCFVKAPYTSGNESKDEVVFEEIRFQPSNLVSAHAKRKSTSPGSYHLSVELKTYEKGDGLMSRSAVTDAATQVMRGMNGLVDHLFPYPATGFSEAGSRLFLPVIFTTAELWTSEIDLGEADLASGELPAESVVVKEHPWIWFTYNQSPALRHGVPSGDSSTSLSQSLRNEFARSIAIVGANGMDAFLGSALPDWLS